jgi:hypothetical protein
MTCPSSLDWKPHGPHSDARQHEARLELSTVVTAPNLVNHNVVPVVATWAIKVVRSHLPDQLKFSKFPICTKNITLYLRRNLSLSLQLYLYVF